MSARNTKKPKAKQTLKQKRSVEVGSKEEQDYLAQLYQDMMRTNDDYVQYVQDSVKLNEVNDFQIDTLNRYYNSILLMQCVRPLQNGIDSSSMIQTVGMYTGMCLFSPDFSKNCHKSVQSSLYPAVAMMAEKAGPDSKWAKRRDMILKEQNGGRLPLTPKSAALQQIAFSRRLYNELRIPGADVEALMTDYSNACSTLENHIEQDGLSLKEVVKTQHVIIGEMIEQDPSVALMFEGLSDGNIKKSDFKKEPYTSTNELGRRVMKERYVWNGEFETKDGESYDDLFFVPRVPREKDVYASQVSDLMQDVMKDCETFEDVRNVGSSEKYRKNMQHIIQLMLNDKYDLDGISDTCGFVISAYQQDWLDTHPEEAAKEKARQQAETKEAKKQASYKQTSWEDTDEYENDTGYGL